MVNFWVKMLFCGVAEAVAHRFHVLTHPRDAKQTCCKSKTLHQSASLATLAPAAQTEKVILHLYIFRAAAGDCCVSLLLLKAHWRHHTLGCYGHRQVAGAHAAWPRVCQAFVARNKVLCLRWRRRLLMLGKQRQRVCRGTTRLSACVECTTAALLYMPDTAQLHSTACNNDTCSRVFFLVCVT